MPSGKLGKLGDGMNKNQRMLLIGVLVLIGGALAFVMLDWNPNYAWTWVFIFALFAWAAFLARRQ